MYPPLHPVSKLSGKDHPGPEEEEGVVMGMEATWITASGGHTFSVLLVQDPRLWQPFTVGRHLVSKAGNQDLSVVLVLAPCSFPLHKPFKQEVYDDSSPRNDCKQDKRERKGSF